MAASGQFTGDLGLTSRAPLASAAQARSGSAPVAVPAGTLQAVSWQSFEAPDARASWDALAAGASEPNPFYESWYLLPSFRALDPLGTVRVLRFECAGKLAGFLPLARSARYYRYPAPHLASWVHANCFLGLPLVTAGLERDFWQAVLAWADRNPTSGLFLHLSHLPLEGPLYKALQDVLTQQNRPGALVFREDRALLASELSPDAYLEAALSGKKRKELRRQTSRLAELGELRLEHHDNAELLQSWITDFLALEHSGWKGTAGSALASHEATAALFSSALSGAAAHGKLQRLTLWLDDAPLAMLASFLTPPGAYAYKTAFDERYARYSPGVLLQRENLKLLERPEIRWCDSCAAADHPMIDHLWRERRAIGRISIAIGGRLRRFAFRLFLRAELGRNPMGLEA